MSKYNQAEAKYNILMKLAGKYDLTSEEQEEEARRFMPTRGNPVAPSVSLKPSTGPMAVPVSRNRTNYDDFEDGNEAMEPEWNHMEVVKQVSPLGDYVRTLTKWLKEAATSIKTGQEAPVPPADWLTDIRIPNSDKTFVQVFQNTTNYVFSRLGVSEPQTEQFLSAAISSKSFGDEPTDAVEQEDKDAAFINALQQLPSHSKAFANMMGQLALTNPTAIGIQNFSKIRKYENRLDAFNSALLTAFGTNYIQENKTKKRSNADNNLNFWRENMELMPESVKRQAGENPANVANVIQQNLPVLNNRVEALSLFFTPDGRGTNNKQKAAELDPELSQNPALLQNGFKALVRRFKSQFNYKGWKATQNEKDNLKNKSSLDKQVGKNKKNDFGSTISQDAQQGRTDQLDSNAVNQGAVSRKALELKQALHGVADKIREAGRDMAMFVSKSPYVYGEPGPNTLEQGKNLDPTKSRDYKEQSFKSATRIRVYTNALAASIASMCDPHKNDPMLDKFAEKLIKRDSGMLSQNDSFSLRPKENLADDPSNIEQGLNPDQKRLWQQSTQYRFSPENDLSKVTSQHREDLMELINSKDFKARMNMMVQRLSKSTYFSNATKLLTNVMSNGKALLYDDFKKWAPFFLLDEVQSKYDLVTRRVLTDMIPVRPNAATGQDYQYGGQALLYYAIRGDLHKMPQPLKWVDINNPDTNPPVMVKGKPKQQNSVRTNPQEALQQVQYWKDWAKANMGRAGIQSRWDRWQRERDSAQAVKNHAMAMAKSNSFFKQSNADMLIIDSIIDGIDRQLVLESERFFRLLRA